LAEKVEHKVMFILMMYSKGGTMKKLTMAAVIVLTAVVAFDGVSAEMVDIGLGQMERSEFLDLKAMVQGRPTNSTATLSTPIDRPERYGMVEMARADFAALRDQVAGRNVGVDAEPMAQTLVQVVNIGTGEMPLDEFMALKRRVEGTVVLTFGHLAAAQP
jgi:hypothetical protein